MCWNITRVSVWLLSNVHFVQRQRPDIRPTIATLPYLKARIIAAVKNIDAHMLTCVWQELEYPIAVCSVTRCAHIEHL